MKIDAGIFQRQTTVVEDALNLPAEVRDNIFILHAQNFTGPYFVPMIREFDVVAIISAHILEVVTELLTFREQLLETTETTGHWMPAGVNNFGVGQNQVNKAKMPEIVWHFVNEKGGVLPMNAGIVNVLFAELLQFLRGKLDSFHRLGLPDN